MNKAYVLLGKWHDAITREIHGVYTSEFLAKKGAKDFQLDHPALGFNPLEFKQFTHDMKIAHIDEKYFFYIVERDLISE